MREPRNRIRQTSMHAVTTLTAGRDVRCLMPPMPEAWPVGSKFRKKMRTISPKPMVRMMR